MTSTCGAGASFFRPGHGRREVLCRDRQRQRRQEGDRSLHRHPGRFRRRTAAQDGLGEHWVEAGLILLPFSFENRSSAASLLGLDYNSSVIKLAEHFRVARQRRNAPRQLRRPAVSYCAGVFDGYDRGGGSKNPDAELRFTGHAAVNVIGKAETGWFYGQCRLPKESYVSLGAGADAQDKATLTIPKVAEGEEPLPGEVEDSDNYVVDMQSAYVISDTMSLTLNGGYYFWDDAAFKGDTAFAEAGLLIDKTMVTLKYELQNPDAGTDTQDYTAGRALFPEGPQCARGC